MADRTGSELWRVGLISTDPLRVLGLQAVLGDGAEIELVLIGQTGGWSDEGGPEVVILDRSATPHLMELLAEFRTGRPEMRVLVLGPEIGGDEIGVVISAGAKGYVSYSARESEVRMALDVVRDGSVWAPRKVLARLLDDRRDQVPNAPTPPTPPKFTQRETQVLRLLALGHPNRDIGVVLGVDEATVKAHVGRLLRKVGVANRTALTMHSIENKLT